MKDQLAENELKNGDPELNRLCSDIVFSIEEEERIAELVKEYDEDIDQIGNRLQVARGRHQKFDTLGRLKKRVDEQHKKDDELNAVEGGSTHMKLKSKKGKRNLWKTGSSGNGGKKGKKDKDCNLI